MAAADPNNLLHSPHNVRAWTVVMAGLGLNLILGALYAWGVLAKALVIQWNWTKTEASLPFTCATAAFAITMIFAGRLQDRIGPRFVALAASLWGAGLIASSFVSTPFAMSVTFGVVGGIGIGLGYSATTPPAIKWFAPEQKGLITGLVVCGVGVAAIYVGPLTEFLLSRQSISQTFLTLGIGATIAIVVLSQALANPPADHKPPARAVRSLEPVTNSPVDVDWPGMLQTPRFYILWAMFVMAASAGLMIIAHVAIIAREQAGLGWGFMPIAMLALFNTLGRISSGYVSDRIGRRNTMVLAFALQALNMFLFALYGTPGWVMFGAAVTGLCYGAIFTLMPSSIADSYGVRNLGVNYGLLFTAYGVAGVCGPMVAGAIRDFYGSYFPAFLLSGVLLFVGALLALLLSSLREVNPRQRR